MLQVVDQEWLTMFSPSELQVVFSGTDAPVDIDDLMLHTNYGAPYSIEHPTIVMFWRVVRTLTDGQIRDLLKFVTSCKSVTDFRQIVAPLRTQNHLTSPIFAA
jgi:ubiquitin-protein ligase E3 C